MASRLTEDQIKWILTLDASAAEKEINSLIKVNKELQEANKGVQKEMRQLEAAGKKESDEYRNLNGVLRENNNTLKANREQIKRLENQMGLANLSMSQLRRRAQDLESQMNRTSRNLHPEEWNKLQKELTETRSKMDELKKAGKQAEKSLGGTILNKGMWATLAGNVLTQVTNWLWSMVSGMKDLVAEGVNMAAAADGVTRAFEALDRPDLLDNLRKATKGTVNDLELMKAANMAKDFRIPLEDLGKYLEFAQLKAQQTGQSVEYMTNSIVTGLGRKSVLILDNLGLSAAEINEQMAKTGDFMSAVASIVDKQLAEAGGSYISEADKMAQRTVKLQNAQMKLGETLLPLKQNLDATFGSFKTGILEATGWVVKNRAAIGELIAVIGAYIAIKKTLIAVNTQSMVVSKKEMALQALEEVQVRASIAAEYDLAAAKALLTGNIKKATTAMRSFLLTLGLNPITAITMAVTAATYGIYKLCTRTNEAKAAMNDFTSEMLTEKRELDKLFNALKNAADKTKEKKDIIDVINKQYKDYLPNLLTEHSTLEEIKTAYDLINRKLRENIALKTLNEKANDIESKSLENKTKQINDIRDVTGKAANDPACGALVDLKGLKYVISVNMNNFNNQPTALKAEEGGRVEEVQDVVSTRPLKYQTRLQRFNDIFKRIADYFSDPNYFKVDGKPMVVIIAADKTHSLDSKKLYADMRAYVKEERGYDMFLVARQGAFTPPGRYQYYFVGNVDALCCETMYKQTNYNRSQMYPQLIDQNWAYFQSFLSSNFGHEFIPTVSPAFNWYVENLQNYAQYPLVVRNKDTFKTLCNVAKRNLGRHPIVFVDSFNDWNTNTAIEPTDPAYGDGYGTEYLDFVRAQFKR